jgi:histidinol phosphatase-like PHP family hydrolase
MPDEKYSKEKYDAYYEAREKLFELISENGVSLDDVS